MTNARDEFADLLIDALKDYILIFLLQRQIPPDHRFTIGQLAKRILKTRLAEMLTKYSEDQLREIVNLNHRVLKEKIRAHAGNSHNPAAG
jgi:hypothetical protein